MHRFVPSLLILLLSAGPALAADPGQADLDRATEIRITATSLQELSDAIQLCREAIIKGLQEDNEKYARELLLSAQFQRAAELAEQLYQTKGQNPRAFLWLQVAAGDIRDVLAASPENGHALYVAARLHRLVPSETARAKELINKAIEHLPAEPIKARALELRAELTRSREDCSEALRLDPRSHEALLLRAALSLEADDAAAAAADLEQALVIRPGDFRTLTGLADAYTALDRLEEALACCNALITSSEEASEGYHRRAAVRAKQQRLEDALADLNETLRRSPRNLLVLLIRARVNFNLGNVEAARADVDRALSLEAEFPPALFIRSLIAAAERRFPEAIADARTLTARDPQNAVWRMHLASCCLAFGQPRQALEELDALVEQETKDPQVFRLRGDAQLRLGDHGRARAEYEAVLKLAADDEGTLNNLSWLLATSPDAEIRDGAQAVKYATRAAEISNHAKPHILSTLAAAYAEVGDFEAALKWVDKGLELVDDEHRKSLENERSHYVENRPFRERKDATAGRPSADDLQLK